MKNTQSVWFPDRLCERINGYILVKRLHHKSKSSVVRELIDKGLLEEKIQLTEKNREILDDIMELKQLSETRALNFLIEDYADKKHWLTLYEEQSKREARKRRREKFLEQKDTSQ